MLADASQKKLAIEINQSALANDLDQYKDKLKKSMSAAYLTIYKHAYEPTKTALAEMENAGILDDCCKKLHISILKGDFTANINMAMSQGGEQAASATWFLYNMWISLKSMDNGYFIDTIITHCETSGMMIPEMITSFKWWNGGYTYWFDPLNGNDVYEDAKVRLEDDFPEMAYYLPGPSFPIKYTIKNGYAKSFCFWGKLNCYANSNELKEANGLMYTKDGTEYLIKPNTDRYVPVRDMRGIAEKNGSKKSFEQEQALEQAFLKKRLRMAHMLSQEDQSQNEETEKMIRGLIGEEGEEVPIPGGVGYGTFFQDSYKQNYRTGTVIAVDIICPLKPGGNVDTWLYLTETNRTAKGVEALVYYYGQRELGFKIFDWAREDHWQVSLSADQLKEYLTVKTIQGMEKQVLSLQNQSFTIENLSDQRWTNRVYLYNYQRDQYDLIYSYDFHATESEQKSGWIGSWGPIVETFQDTYQNTNPFGFSYTYMQERDESEHWTSFHLLTKENSEIRNDQKGFQLSYLLPNHSFEVH